MTRTVTAAARHASEPAPRGRAAVPGPRAGPPAGAHHFALIAVDVSRAPMQRAVESREGKYYSDIDPSERLFDTAEEAESHELQVMSSALGGKKPAAPAKPAHAVAPMVAPKKPVVAEKPVAPEPVVAGVDEEFGFDWKESRRGKRGRDKSKRPAYTPKRERDAARTEARSARVVPRDDSQMSFRPITSDTVRVYRTEVRDFDERYSHVAIQPGRKNAHIYTPPPQAQGRLPALGGQQGRKYATGAGGYQYDQKPFKGLHIPSKRTPKRDPSNPERYARKFLKGRERGPKGTMTWVNFGERERAEEFYKQKSSNPKEKGKTFQIKSFEVPAVAYHAIRADTVHESAAEAHPTKALNVDRAHPNQFGIQQHHAELLNELAIPGTALVHKPPKPPPMPKPPRVKKPSALPKGSLLWGKGGKGRSALDDEEAGALDAQRELDDA